MVILNLGLDNTDFDNTDFDNTGFIRVFFLCLFVEGFAAIQIFMKMLTISRLGGSQNQADHND
jgi:hypothetical protein